MVAAVVIITGAITVNGAAIVVYLGAIFMGAIIMSYTPW